MFKKFLFATILSLLVLMTTIGAVGCVDNNDLKESKKAQKTVTERAYNAVPPYIPNEYSAREDINWYLQETEGRYTWYTYALSMTGQPLFYILSDMKPRNICVHLTSPERIVNRNVVLSAPALDGVYYGKSGCDAYYTRDATTGAFIELAGRTFTLISSKTPLFIETDIERLTSKE